MTDQPPSESAITLHNRALAFEVLKRTQTFSRYPRVSEQVQCLPLETHKLRRFGYNPAINSRGWMAYRFHKGLPSTKLAVAQLGKDGTVLSDRELVIAGGFVGEDDPKIWSHAGDDWISWVESNWIGQNPTGCCVKRAKFNDMQLGDVIQDALPGNDGSTWVKNLVYFDYEGQLLCIYQCHPTHRIYTVPAGQVYETEGPRWPYGEIRGGTAPLPYDGKLLRFFHSRCDNEHLGGNWRHRYFVGAYIMEPEPPFKVVRVSKRPIIYASELGAVRKSECYHFKQNVVFPGGAIETKGGWLLALGINDAEIAIAKITPEQLNF